MIFFAIIFYLIGLLFVAAGIAIYKGKTGLIHYYHRQNVTDLVNYGKAMGKAISGMGASCGIAATISLFGEELITISIGVFFIGFMAMFVIIFFIQRKYNGSMFS
jgi:maltodextrin utilization protein YvdJ